MKYSEVFERTFQLMLRRQWKKERVNVRIMYREKEKVFKGKKEKEKLERNSRKPV